MDELLDDHSEDDLAQNDLDQSSSQQHSISAVSEESVMGGGVGEARSLLDQTQSEGPDTFAAALQPPSEARFRQLASLHLLVSLNSPSLFDFEVDLAAGWDS